MSVVHALGIFGLFFPDGVFTTFSLGARHISSGEDKMIVSARVLVIAIDIRLPAFAEDCRQQQRHGHEAPSAPCLPCSGKRYDAVSFHVIAKAFWKPPMSVAMSSVRRILQQCSTAFLSLSARSCKFSSLGSGLSMSSPVHQVPSTSPMNCIALLQIDLTLVS